MLKERIVSLIEKQKEKGSKKNIENAIVFLILIVITLIAMNTILKEDEHNENENNYSIKTSASEEEKALQQIEEDSSLEKRLETILKKIDGVGNVSVLITYSETSETVAMFNETEKETATQEEDTSGGTRTIKEKDYAKEVIYKEENGKKIPVTQKLLLPKIEGAIIIAEGARNADVKTMIVQAVEAATGLATHKIQVFSMQL